MHVTSTPYMVHTTTLECMVHMYSQWWPNEASINLCFGIGISLGLRLGLGLGGET